MRAKFVENGPALGEPLEAALIEVEKKATDALSRYKFQMFGYWAAIWVHLNRISGLNRENPWRSVVHEARRKLRGEA